MVHKGAGSSGAEDSYRAALALADRLGDAAREFIVLWGLWFITYQRGEHAAALEGGQRLLAAAQASGDRGHLVEAHHSMWATATALGNPTMCVAHADEGLALYDPAEHARQALSYGGHDAGACALYQRGMNRWLLGYPDRAVDDLRQAARLANELGHPTTSIITSWFGAWLSYQRGERQAAIDAAQEARERSDAHGVLGWTDCAMVLPHLTGRPSAATLAELHERLAGQRTTTWRRVFAFCVLAELCVEAGEVHEGIRALEAVPPKDRTGFLAPELHRLRGELALLGGARDAAEAELRAAVELARRRGEKSLELRAVVRLGRLLAERGAREDARRLVGDVYGGFTEGFATRDLTDARAFLESLG